MAEYLQRRLVVGKKMFSVSVHAKTGKLPSFLLLVARFVECSLSNSLS